MGGRDSDNNHRPNSGTTIYKVACIPHPDYRAYWPVGKLLAHRIETITPQHKYNTGLEMESSLRKCHYLSQTQHL